MTTNVQNSCQCERFCAGTSHWMEKLFPGEHRGLVTDNDAAAFLYSLEVGLQDSCFPSFSSRLLVLLVLTEVSDSCCGHSHHHTSLLLWVENPEEIQGQVMNSFLILPQSILCSLFCLSRPLFVCGKTSHHVSLPTLHCCPYHFSTWRRLPELVWKLWTHLAQNTASYEQSATPFFQAVCEEWNRSRTRAAEVHRSLLKYTGLTFTYLFASLQWDNLPQLEF